MEESFIMPTGMYQSCVEELFEEAQIKPSILFEVHDCTTISAVCRGRHNLLLELTIPSGI